MDLNGLKAAVEAAKAREAARLERDSAAECRAGLRDEADSWLPKVREWLQCLDYLASEGYDVTEDRWPRGCPCHRELGVVIPEGGGPVTEIACRAAVGWSTPREIRTDGVLWYTVDRTGVRGPMTNDDYADLVCRYGMETNLMERFGEWFDRLCGRVAGYALDRADGE